MRILPLFALRQHAAEILQRDPPVLVAVSRLHQHLQVVVGDLAVAEVFKDASKRLVVDVARAWMVGAATRQAAAARCNAQAQPLLQGSAPCGSYTLKASLTGSYWPSSLFASKLRSVSLVKLGSLISDLYSLACGRARGRVGILEENAAATHAVWRRAAGGAHGEVLVKGAKADSQVGLRQPASALHIEELERGIQFVLVNRQTSGAGKGLEVVLTQADYRIGPF